MGKVIANVLALLFFVSFLCIYVHINLEDWRQRVSCSERITGILKKKYIDEKRTMGIGRIVHVHVRLNCEFYYIYHGKEYTSLSLDEPSYKVFHSYKEGREYPIYINPQKCQHIRCWSVEGKYHFLLNGLRTLLLLISMICTIALTMMNIQNRASWKEWIFSIFFFIVFVGSVILINKDKKWRNDK